MALIKIKYNNGDKGWALLDEREFVEGVHERWVEPVPEKPKSDKLIDNLGETVEKPRRSRKG